MTEKIVAKDAVEYAKGSIVSKQIINKKTGTVTLFAFDKGQSLSEHTAPFDALVQAVDGSGRITLGGDHFDIAAGEMIVMPANVAHAVSAVEQFKMILTMIKE
jgi:quercetin dioxygenase-like cupin family protein